MAVDTASKMLAVRPTLPPTNAPARELWTALEARGQLTQRLTSLSGVDPFPNSAVLCCAVQCVEIRSLSDLQAM